MGLGHEAHQGLGKVWTFLLLLELFSGLMGFLCPQKIPKLPVLAWCGSLICNMSTLEVKAGGLWQILGQPDLHT